MKTLKFYLKPKLGKMAVCFFVKFLGTVAELLLPYLLTYILEEITPKNDVNEVYLWGGVMVFCAVCAMVFNILANRMSTRISREVTRALRKDLFVKVMYLSSSQVDKYTMPSILTRLTSDTYYVHQMVDRMQRLGVRAPILLLGGIALTFLLDPVLTLVLIALLPVLAFISIYISQKGVPLYDATQRSQDEMVRKVRENMTGVRVIKALSKTDYEKERFTEINAELMKRDQKANLLMAKSGPLLSFVLYLGLTIVVFVGAFRVEYGVMTPEKIVPFLSYFVLILNAIIMVTRIFTLYTKGAASAKRIEEVMIASKDMLLINDTEIKNDFRLKFENVSFSYNKKRNDIENISFELKKGDTLGIIGGTGSGKTTLISLMLRLYDADSGSITVDGRDIRSIPAGELHRKFGVVFQNDFVYADTIKENILLGRHISETDVASATKTAQADIILAGKEGGLEHKLTGAGANLSGGQKQRLLISRALAGNPEILILDDSSSALDYKTDANLRKALRSNYGDTTTVIVAQRISSIQYADLIIMLDGGKVIGMGTHEQLLASCEQYKDIYQVQMGAEELL